MQSCDPALKGLTSSILHIDHKEIKSLEVMNPIRLGETIEDKEFILDIRVCMNDDTHIDMELQVINYHDWPDRSLQYLSREFDDLKRGQYYSESMTALHIGILDFELFPGENALVDLYMILNVKTKTIYNEHFKIYIMTLPKRDDPTQEDELCHTDLWARFFKACTWEELKMLAEKDLNIEAAVCSTALIWKNEEIRARIRAREDYERRQRWMHRQMEEAKSQIEEAKSQMEEAKSQIEEERRQKEEERRQKEEERRQKEKAIDKAARAEEKLKLYEQKYGKI